MATGGAHRLELGAVSGNGAVTAITKAAVEARGGSMQTETGRVDGAAEIANAPGGTSWTPPPGSLSSAGMTLGATHTSGITATGTLSDPAYGAPAVGSGASGSFAVDQIRPELGLDPVTPIVTLDAGTAASMPGGGPCPAANGVAGDGAAGAGWMDTGVASPKTLAACAQTEASTVKLFPTTATAPQGLIQVETLGCDRPLRDQWRDTDGNDLRNRARPMADDQPVDLLAMDGGDAERHNRHGHPARPDDAACQRQGDRRLHRKLDGIRRRGGGGHHRTRTAHG